MGHNAGGPDECELKTRFAKWTRRHGPNRMADSSAMGGALTMPHAPRVIVLRSGNEGRTVIAIPPSAAKGTRNRCIGVFRMCQATAGYEFSITWTTGEIAPVAAEPFRSVRDHAAPVCAAEPEEEFEDEEFDDDKDIEEEEEFDDDYNDEIDEDGDDMDIDEDLDDVEDYEDEDDLFDDDDDADDNFGRYDDYEEGEDDEEDAAE